MLSVGFPFGLVTGTDVEVTGCVFLALPLPPLAVFDFLERGLSLSESSEPSSSSSSSLVLGSARRGFFVAVEFLKRRDCRLPVPYPMTMKINFTYNSISDCDLQKHIMKRVWHILRTNNPGETYYKHTVYIFLIQITLKKKFNNEEHICSGTTSLSMHLDKLAQEQGKFDLTEGAPGSNLCRALSSFSLVSPHI